MSDAGGYLPGSAAMTQQAFSSDVPQDQGNTPVVSAGSLIRHAREAAGLHIAALAVALKVPVKKLEALEADRLDLLPDAVFARALAASVCRTLKIDVAQVLALLPQSGKPTLGQQSAPINAPFRSPGDGPGPSLMAQVSRPAVLAGLLLLFGALVLIFLPALQQAGMSSPPAASPAVAVADTPIIPAAGVLSGVAMAKPDLLDTDKSTVINSTLQPVAVSGIAPVTAALSPQALVVVQSPPPVTDGVPAATAVMASSFPTAAVPPVTEGVIVFKAKGQSWVEVTDAKGTVVLRRTLAPGEEAGASGVLPLSAVVGRVDATQVEVRGKAFDLAAVSKDNVARFEVK